MQERQTLENSLNDYNVLKIEFKEIAELIELASIDNDEKLLQDLNNDLINLQRRVNSKYLETLLSGEVDINDAYLEIHSGAGGTESQDWASMLLRMYIRWSEKRKFKSEIISMHDGDEAGIKSAVVLITGAFAYGWLKKELGVHRLVRISPFDSNSRRHTSFASVDVYPVIDDKIDIQVSESDVRIDTYRASGAGGQHVNTTDSAVRITHLPTGIVVTQQDERSQHKNKAKALKILRSRIYDVERQKKQQEESSNRKSQVGSGDRSERIRTYNFPQGRVSDHRINLTLYKLDQFLTGEALEEMISALSASEQAEKLSQLDAQ